MRRAVIGLLAAFVITLILYTVRADLLTGNVNLRPLTNNGPVVYQQLEPDISNTSLRVAEMNTGSESLFTSPSFLYTLLFVLVIVRVSLLYFKKVEEKAWEEFQKSLNENEKE